MSDRNNNTTQIPEYPSAEALNHDPALLALTRYEHQKALVNGREVIIVPTMQQIEDLIYCAAGDLCETIFRTYALERNDGLIEDIRDAIYEKLEENEVCFLPLCEEY